MKAEIAGIVILAFFGTMSQIKIWKIVKETKSKRDAERLAHDEAREAEEAELGRVIEERNKHDRAEWEGNYGEKKMPQESTISIDAYGKATSTLDLTNNAKYGDRRVSFPLVQLRPATKDENSPVALKRMPSENSLSPSENKRASAVSSIDPLDSGHGEGEVSPESTRLKSPSSTSLTIPGSPNHETQESMDSLALRSSVALPSPEHDQDVTKRSSVATRRLSSISLAAKEALEANEEPYEPVEEDLASSVAATAAESPDADALSVVISRPASMFLSPAAVSPHPINEQFIEEDDEALNLARRSMIGGSSPGSPDKRASYFDITPAAQDAAVETSLSEKLPMRMSKAALNHRTNEWAKEVGRAEPEPIEEVEDHTMDAVQVESSNAADAARAEENNAAPPPSPPPKAPERVLAPVREHRRFESTNPYRQSKRLSRTPSNPPLTRAKTESEDSWSVPLGKRRSSNPLSSIPARNPSTATLNNEHQTSSGNFRTLSPMSSMPNLLDERRDMLGRRITTTSFMVPTISEDVKGTSESSKGDNASLSENTKPSTNTSIGELEDDDENMTLAQRKALVQQQQQEQQNFGYTNFGEPSPHTLTRQTSQAFQMRSLSRQGSQMFQPQQPLSRRPSQQVLQSPIEPVSPGAGQALRMSGGGMMDTHQPRRMSSHNFTKQAMNWNAWRSSTALDAMAQEPVIAHDSQMDMLRAMRVQSEAEAKQRQQEAQVKQAQMDAHMRMGGMDGAHRAALARMQGKANAKAQ